MNGPSAGSGTLEKLADEFLGRWRRGEKPTIDEYADAHPAYAAQIRRLFPTILLAENMGASDRRDTTAPPERLGEYRLLREIGRGGMGVVYEAVHEPLGRLVAIKLLPATAHADPRFRERFLREARAAGKLHHTNIVPVFDVGVQEGTDFYAMQYIAGRGLDAVLRQVARLRAGADTRPGVHDTGVVEKPSDAFAASAVLSGTQVEYFRSVARIGVQVAGALAYAHRQGIVHRDIKPSNLLMDADGTVWVTDFGLAKSDEDATLTGTGDFVGTLRYMPPERFRGESGPAGDIYSLGVTLYELITLRSAFDETDRHKLLDQVLRHEPVAPRTIDPRVPRDLETVVLKAMAKETRDRYSSAQALADDLQQFLDDRPITARRARVTERIWRWCRRNPVPASLLGAVAVLALVILIGSPIVSIKLWKQRLDARIRLHTSSMMQARSERLTDEAGRRRRALWALDGASETVPQIPEKVGSRLEVRNEYIACLSLSDLEPNRRAEVRLGANVAGITFDHKFERYAIGDTEGAVSIRRADDHSELLKLEDNCCGAWAPKFSPDGKHLAVGYHHKYQVNSERFRVWNLDTGKTVLSVDTETGCGDADFSPDGRFVAFGKAPKELVIHDLSNGEQKKYEVPSLPTAIAYHPSAQKLAVACRRSIEIRDAANGKVLQSRAAEIDVWAVAWHPAGQVLAVAAGKNILLCRDDGKLAATLRGHELAVYGLAFNPTGDLLASKCYDGSIRLWQAASGRSISRTNSVFVGCVPIQFSADGKQVALGSDGAAAWTFNVVGGRECRWLAPAGYSTNLVNYTGDFTADGKRLAVAYGDGVRIWNCETGRLESTTQSRGCRHLRFTADGKQLFGASNGGLLSWPVVTGENGALSLGTIKPIVTDVPIQILNVLPDPKKLLVRKRDRPAEIITLTGDAPPVVFGEHPRVSYASVSPNGMLVATGNEHGAFVRIWDAATGQLVKELPIQSSATVEFSPDGKRLLVGSESTYSYYTIINWQVERLVAKEPEASASEASFSADGAMVAVRDSPSRLRLLDPSTDTELATFAGPNGAVFTWHRLSRDGRYLAAGGAFNTVYLWDVAEIRRQLSAGGLDW